MHAISGVMQSILPQVIIVSMHIDMHIPQSFIHRHIEVISIFIISIEFPLPLVEFRPWPVHLS
jgi:hypothetical protein